MKKIALPLLALLLASLALPARAAVTCSLPFNLQNGTTADATQVMANYNALLNCFGNAAASGVNNDITALTALSTPLTPAQGGTPVYIGGTSTGSANAQVVAVTIPSTFALTAGNQVTFTAGFTPSGPLTLNVASTGAKNVYRRTQLGISATVGGEFVTGQTVTVLYDGTQFQLVSTPPVDVGSMKDFAGSTSPAGWAFIDGSCQSRTGIFADLFSVIGTTYDPTGSTCDTAHFALPDGRGRMLAGRDDMGQGAANRITNAGSGCTGTTLGGAGCGSQNHTQTIDELVSHTHVQNAHTHGLSLLITSNTSTNITVGGGTNVPLSGTGLITDAATATNQNTGGGNPMPILNPLQIVNKIIKY